MHYVHIAVLQAYYFYESEILHPDVFAFVLIILNLFRVLSREEFFMPVQLLLVFAISAFLSERFFSTQIACVCDSCVTSIAVMHYQRAAMSQTCGIP